MRKTFVYILILGIFAFGVWYFLFYDQNIFGENEAGFTFKDTARIEKVFLSNQKGDTIALRRTTDGWTVNTKYRASNRMKNTLLETLFQQSAQYPVPESAHNNVIKKLAGHSIRVEVYEGNNKHLRTFYVGGQVRENKGNYMLIEGAKRPYVVQLPVYEGYIKPRYSLDLAEWRDRSVVNYSPEELKSVSVSYAAEDQYLNSFTVNRTTGDKYTVDLHPELNLTAELNPRRAKLFMTFFEKVGFEGYLNGTHKMDSLIANAEKYCHMDITTTNNHVEHIDIYWMLQDKRSKNYTKSVPGVPDQYDPDRFYGVIHDYKDTVMLQHQTFGKFFRKGYEFYEQDDQ